MTKQPERPPTQAPQPAQSPSTRRLAPPIYGRASGPSWNWLGFEYLASPTPLDGFPRLQQWREPTRAVLFARGFYSHLAKTPRDWNGVEIVGLIEVSEDVAMGFVLHHEFREDIGDLALVSSAVRLPAELSLVTSLAAGSGAEFLPITSLEGELRGPMPEVNVMFWGFGVGASWWTHTRRRLSGTVVMGGWLGPYLAFEQRLRADDLNSDTADARLNLTSTTTFLEGRHGQLTFEQRVSLGDAPDYAPSADLADRPDRLGFDVGVGLRKWIGSSYGYIVNVEFGAQEARYVRFGTDFSVFAEL